MALFMLLKDDLTSTFAHRLETKNKTEIEERDKKRKTTERSDETNKIVMQTLRCGKTAEDSWSCSAEFV